MKTITLTFKGSTVNIEQSDDVTRLELIGACEFLKSKAIEKMIEEKPTGLQCQKREPTKERATVEWVIHEGLVSPRLANVLKRNFHKDKIVKTISEKRLIKCKGAGVKSVDEFIHIKKELA